MKRLIKNASQKSDVIDICEKLNYDVPIDEDGSDHFIVVSVDKEHIHDMTDKFEEQLKQEGKYGWFVAIITAREQITMDCLPIFGNPNSYITKWLFPTQDDAITNILRDRSINLYKRIMRYEPNMQL